MTTLIQAIIALCCQINTLRAVGAGNRITGLSHGFAGTCPGARLVPEDLCVHLGDTLRGGVATALRNATATLGALTGFVRGRENIGHGTAGNTVLRDEKYLDNPVALPRMANLAT
jgi:hypothetical protein